MWLATTLGFFSVTAAPGQSGMIQVRARVEEDLKNLLILVGEQHKEIICALSADYKYRLIVPEKVWLRWAQRLASTAENYVNFKTAVSCTNVPRSKTYLKVWSILCELENEEL